MAPKNPKSATLEERVKNYPPLIQRREKILEVFQQVMKAKADLKRRRVQREKIDWKSEAEALRKLSHHMYSIRKEFEGKMEELLEELAAVRNITSTFNSFTIDSAMRKVHGLSKGCANKEGTEN